MLPVDVIFFQNILLQKIHKDLLRRGLPVGGKEIFSVRRIFSDPAFLRGTLRDQHKYIGICRGITQKLQKLCLIGMRNGLCAVRAGALAVMKIYKQIIAAALVIILRNKQPIADLAQ